MGYISGVQWRMNDRKHDDLCVGSMGIRPMDQQRTS